MVALSSERNTRLRIGDLRAEPMAAAVKIWGGSLVMRNAAGYLTKQSAPELLVTAIRQVASGKKYVSPSLAEELANAIGDDSERPPHEKLSDREYQTLCMIASGKTPAEIAEALNLSVKTVSVYRARLLEKMNLRNNAELTHYGLKHGLAE